MREHYEQTRSRCHAQFHTIPGGIRHVAILPGQPGSSDVNPSVSGYSVSLDGEPTKTGVNLHTASILQYSLIIT